MNLERAALKGLLADKKKKLEEIQIRAEGLVISIRQLINPYVDFLELERLDLAAMQAQELKDLQAEAKALALEIERMEADLYG